MKSASGSNWWASYQARNERRALLAERRDLLDERRQRAQSAREYDGTSPIVVPRIESMGQYRWRTLCPNVSDATHRSGHARTL